MPRAHTSVEMRTRELPPRNSCMMASRSFWGMSPCMLLTVKLACLILSVSQSTCTTWDAGVMATVSLKEVFNLVLRPCRAEGLG